MKQNYAQWINYEAFFNVIKNSHCYCRDLKKSFFRLEASQPDVLKNDR